MRLSTMFFGTGGIFGAEDGRKMKVKESRMWTRAGLEPSTTELLADPIAILLMQADKLQVGEVEKLLHQARRRMPRPRRGQAAGGSRGERHTPHGHLDA